MARLPAPDRVPNQRPLVPSVTSDTGANDKGDNEMIPGAVHRYPGICLTAEENPGKPQLGDRRPRLCGPVIASNAGPFPPNEVVGSHSVRRREGRIEGKDGVGDWMRNLSLWNRWLRIHLHLIHEILKESVEKITEYYYIHWVISSFVSFLSPN